MLVGLANAWWTQVRDRPEEDLERLAAAKNLTWSVFHQGDYAEATAILRGVHTVQARVLGPEDPVTLETAHNLASSISAHGPGEHAEAETMQREVHAAQGGPRS